MISPKRAKMLPIFSPKPLSLWLLFVQLVVVSGSASASASALPSPSPTPWPPQFHSILVINSSKGLLQVTDLWYDFPNGRNFNIIQNQLGEKLYDLEWDNGTSFYYTLDAPKQCQTMLFPVGILRPNWLEGAHYLGQETKDGFLCNVWEKADFIRYYEDVATNRPVFWAFYTGMTSNVMTFEVGKVLPDPNWQAPVYCFQDPNAKHNHIQNSLFKSFAFITDFPTIPMLI